MGVGVGWERRLDHALLSALCSLQARPLSPNILCAALPGVQVAEIFALVSSGESCSRFQDYRLTSELECTILF